jgi:hypothetical protein
MLTSFHVLAAVMFNLYDFCDSQNVGTLHGRIPVKALSCVLANTVSDKYAHFCTKVLDLTKHNTFVSYPVQK